MRILSLLYVYLLVLYSQGTVLVPAPVRAKLSSRNFIHVLEWTPGNGTQPRTVYNVKIDKSAPLQSNSTSMDITKYMTNIFSTYKIKLWATSGTRSSPTVEMIFCPLTGTIIGPPILSLFGCGDCLNISIDLSHLQAVNNYFYKSLYLDIFWKKVKDDTDDCNSTQASNLITQSVSDSHVLQYLQPGERYCVKVQPKSTHNSNVLSSCACQFTSTPETIRVTFLVRWVFGCLMVGLCLLTIIFSLAYTGFLCKPNATLPKALITLVPGYFLSPEETCISLIEVEHDELKCLLEMRKTKKEEEKGNAVSRIMDDVDEDEDEESQHGYMDRAALGGSENTASSGRSASMCDIADDSASCSVDETPTDTRGTLSLSELMDDGVKGDTEAAPLNPVPKNLNPLNVKDAKVLQVPMKEEEDDGDSGNVNLLSVVLKSMQVEEEEEEEEETDDPGEATESLIPLILKELKGDLLSAAESHTGSASEAHMAQLLHTHTEFLIGQEEHCDVSDAVVSDHRRTGYMASHAGTVDSEECSSEDEDEDYASAYLNR